MVERWYAVVHFASENGHTEVHGFDTEVEADQYARERAMLIRQGGYVTLERRYEPAE